MSVSLKPRGSEARVGARDRYASVMTAETASTATRDRRSAPIGCSCGDGCSGRQTVSTARIEAMNHDFESLAGTRPSAFVCPLCAREVDRGCVSLAHAPSKRLGGRAVTLTCRRCNSRMGTWYEAHTVTMVRNRQASKSGTWTERIRAGSDDPG